jgi:hypothetical protein
MGFVDRSRIEKRLSGAARAAYLWGSLGLILVCLLWWAGRVDFGGAMLGNLSALYFYAYASLQVPAGVMMDRLAAVSGPA